MTLEKLVLLLLWPDVLWLQRGQYKSLFHELLINQCFQPARHIPLDKPRGLKGRQPRQKFS